MTPIEYPTFFSALAEGLVKGAGIGGLIAGAVGALGLFLVVVGLCGWGVCVILGALESAQGREEVSADDPRGDADRVAGRSRTRP